MGIPIVGALWAWLEANLGWSVVVTITGGLLVITGEIVESYVEHYVESPNRKQKIVPHCVVFFGGVLCLVSAYFASGEQTAFQRDLQKQNAELTSIATGGDSFCYLGFPILAEKSMVFAVIHKGKYPLYDVNITIDDMNRADAYRKKHPELFKKGSTYEELMAFEREFRYYNSSGNLVPNRIVLSVTLPRPIAFEQKYHVSIWARNMYMEQTLLLRFSPEGTRWATQVWRVAPETREGKQERRLLHEFIMKGFKRTENEVVSW